MKKVLALVAIAGFLTIGISTTTYAADGNYDGEELALLVQGEEGAEEGGGSEDPDEAVVSGAADDVPITTGFKRRFIEGGPFFMGIVLMCLILGLALIIERIVYLNMATTNTKKLLQRVEDALASGGVEAAKEVCRNTRGPVASIFYQGLDRSDEGIEMVEKSVVAYGGVQMGLMEKGMSWIGLFIALAPMLGFMGTVIGMIRAFDDIATVGTISASIVATGIKIALLTTVFGLIVAIILQIFYNYLLAKIDSLVNDMEDASISLIDIMLKHKVTSD